MKSDVTIARLIGSAGSGKTTELLRIMEGALDRLGRDPLRLGLASFTRAARAEAVERAAGAWDISPEVLSGQGWFRTVHSTCKRCLGVDGGQLLTDRRADVEWVSNALGVKLSTDIDEDSGGTRFIGDPTVAASLNCWSLCRSSMRPLEEVARRIRRLDDNAPDYDSIVRVCERYEAAKRVDDRVDFTDLLARFAGLRFDPREGLYRVTPEGETPPVDAWLFDEQQDASPLLDAVCKRLVSGPTVRWCYVVGDPFQAIYGFAGSSAECFLAWDAAKEKVMPKSYRCPRPILELGEKCLQRMKAGYFRRDVSPADHEGSVEELGCIEDAVHKVNPEESWLLIARTNYQAGRLFAAMSEARKPCRWVKSPEGTPARYVGMAALYELEKGNPITGEQWARATEILPSRNKDGDQMLVRGTKSQFKKAEVVEQWDAVWLDEIGDVGGTAYLRDFIANGRWVSLVDRGSEWRQKADKYGTRLAGNPAVRVGTIHSVKGAEADNVVLLTTTSGRVMAGGDDPEQHDEEHRIAYVGVTRTRRNLFVVNEGGPKTPRMEVL